MSRHNSIMQNSIEFTLIRHGARTLGRGSEGDDVRTVQAALLRLGRLRDSFDGVYGPDTVAAVAQFQRDYWLNPTGEVDAATLTALTDVVKLAARGRRRSELPWGISEMVIAQ